MSRLTASLLAGCLSMSVVPSQAVHADDVRAIVRDFDAYSLRQDPIRAAQLGDLAAAQRWPDDTPKAVAQRRESLLEFQRRLRAVAPATLTATEALDRQLLTARVDLALEGLRFDEERMPFISGDGFYTASDYAALNTNVVDEATGEAWIARLEALPRYFANATANMRRGIETGYVQPRQTVERAIADVRAQLELPPEKTPLLGPFRSMPGAMSAPRRAALQARGRAAFEQDVRPAQRALLDFLEHEYLPRARPGIGIGTVPGGSDYYAYLARRHTSTALSPAEIHAIGLREVARIRARMDEAIAATGFKGTFAEFLAAVRKDPRFYVSGAEYGEKASEVAKRADYLLPRYFRTLPRLTYGVRPMPEGLESSANGYLSGSPEQGVAGMVVYKPWMSEKMPTFGIAAWVLHEGVPGHHLQIALSQELEGLPEFRRNADVTAYVEGWALYSERLGEEMGIYRDPYEQFGRLSLEMWRACRLVIDTGMHVMGWSRDRAVACLADNSALAPAEIEFEVDRYIAWPGQALAYKVGELKIVELRERAASRLGEKFDLRAFHDLLLAGGAMPLDVLETRVDHWIEAQQAVAMPATAR